MESYMNLNGCTKCREIGNERYEKFRMSYNKKYYYQYDYRHTNGELFSCVAPTLEMCRAKRDKWIDNL